MVYYCFTVLTLFTFFWDELLQIGTFRPLCRYIERLLDETRESHGAKREAESERFGRAFAIILECHPITRRTRITMDIHTLSLSIYIYIYICTHTGAYIPVVPHKAVAEVSKIGNL